MENLETKLTEENYKTLLSQKLENTLTRRSEQLENKFNSDIQEIELMKYEFYEYMKRSKYKIIIFL